MYFSKDGNRKLVMQWKLLPEKVVTRFWKRKRKKQKQSLKIREKRMVQLE